MWQEGWGKMKKILICIAVVLSTIFITSGVTNSDVYAATGKQVCKNDKANGAIKDGCKCASSFGWTYGCGMLWISGSSSSSDVSDTVTATASTGKMTIYLHGAVFASSNYPAKRIKLIKGTSKIKGISSANKHSTYAPFDNTPSQIDRKANSKNGTFSSNVKSFKLDIEKLIKTEGNNYVTSGNYHVYTVPIQVFRCFNNYTSNDACFSSRSDLKISVPAEPPKVTIKLTANAVTTNGTLLQQNISSDSKTVNQGSSATLTVNNNNYNNAGYTFVGWRDNASSGSLTSGNTYTKTISASQTVYAVYERNTFGGRIEASGETSGSIGYTSSSSGSPKYLKISNCSPTDGCKVAFTDYMKRISGSGSTSYQVSRTSNYFTSTRGVANNTNVASGNSGNVNGEKVASDPSSGQFTLYPGMVVCERLSFKAHSDDSDNTTIALCVAAEGNAQPPDPGDSDTNDPSGDSSFVNIKVKNNTVNAYNKYQKTVYAKPFDNLSYLATYNPILQYTYDLIPQKMRIDSGTIYPTDGNNTTRYLGRNNSTSILSMFNYYKNSGTNNGRNLRNWNNGVNVYSENFTSNMSQNYTYNGGLTEKRQMDNSHDVGINEVGRSLVEKISTNVNDAVKTTPGQVSFTLSDNSNIGNVSTVAREKSANALVPYNYENSTRIISNSDNTVLYAGEPVMIDYDYSINPKTNNLTTNPGENRKYATTVGNPKWKLEFCVGQANCDQNSFTYTTSEKLNSTEHRDFSIATKEKMLNGRTGDDSIKLSTSINIPDVAAGTRVCIRSVIFPATSGRDDNYSNPDGDGKWAYSAPVCFVVAKKPSLQVWGGNVYSRGRINTGLSVKRSLSGYSNAPYSVEGSGSNYVFGSFGENGLIAGSTVVGFSSGASTGYARNTDGVLSPNPFIVNTVANTPDAGGGRSVSLCDRSPLTFANSTCGSGFVGMVGRAAGSTDIENDKYNILASFIRDVEDGKKVSGVVTLNDRSKAQPDGTYYYRGDDDLVLNAQSVAQSTIQMVHSDKTIYIKGNLLYDDEYEKYTQLPKLVLYGKNVAIDCNVSRIDALIVADEKVITCDNFNGDISAANFTDAIKARINDAKNSNQLFINGAVVSKSLIANRTYGAATGANSIIPSEVINFDPTLYMWGGLGNDEGGDGNLEVTMFKELAPRR